MTGDWVRWPSRRGSWHVVLTPTRMFDTYRVRCGRTCTTKVTATEPPLDERTCERCAILTLADAAP
jgi:hypothetical protein